MNVTRESERVALRGVDDVDREGQGKKVVDAWLHLEARYGPSPARRVVTIETRDGAVYRFQRYGRGEFLAFYNRENPDGTEFKRRASLPAHVQAVREAIVADDVLPDFEALLRAEHQVGEREMDEATDEDVRQAVQAREKALAPDGGAECEGWRLPARERRADGGKSWVALEQKRRDEARLRSGYAALGGGDE